MRLGDRTFFNQFARLAAATNPDRDCDEWHVSGVRWRRQRHIHWSEISHQIEVHGLHHSSKPSWTLYFVHEIWWGADRRKTIRNAHWTHLEAGSARDALAWFTERELGTARKPKE